MQINIFRSVNFLPKIVVALAVVGTFFLYASPVVSAQEEAENLEGTVWLIPNQFEMLSIFKVKSDNTVEAGRLGDSEIRWIGTYKNKRLELQNPYYAGSGEYERIEVTVDGSSMTGHHRYKVYTDKSDEPITGYCLNCWVDWTTFGLIGGGGVALLGGRDITSAVEKKAAREARREKARPREKNRRGEKA